MLSAVTSQLHRYRDGLVGAFARYLAQPVGAAAAPASADTRSLAALLRVGDVVLMNGNTRAAALVRRVTGWSWAHVALYVGALEPGADPRCIVEADVAEGVRAIRLSALGGQRVRVLRPSRLEERDRRRIAEWVVGRIGDRYDIAHAWALAGLLLRLPIRSRAAAVSGAMAEGARRFICSTLLSQAFLLIGYPIPPTHVRVREARVADHRYVTPSDFESAAGFDAVSPLE